jgi:hypothetical protein
MLCDVCSSINFHKMVAWDSRSDTSFTRNGGAYHHESYTALLEAARRGCDLCTAIHEEQLAQGPGHHKETPDMEAIESRFGIWKRASAQIYCQFEESRSMVSFRRYTGFDRSSRTTGMAVYGDGDFDVKLRIFAYEGNNFQAYHTEAPHPNDNRLSSCKIRSDHGATHSPGSHLRSVHISHTKLDG